MREENESENESGPNVMKYCRTTALLLRVKHLHIALQTKGDDV